MPQMLLGGAIGVADPLTKGATYIGFNWGSGTAANEPDGEPMLHEWLHSAQWALEEHQGYPPGSDVHAPTAGKMEGEPGGDPCYRRRTEENTWMRFYQHIMRDHVTRRMWRELSPRRSPSNVWVQEHPVKAYVDPSHLDCPWPKMSHYKQPWRGYMETRSGDAFLQGLGVNLHIPEDCEQLAVRLLAETGFKSFRIEVGWGEMGWDETKLNNEGRFRRQAGALRQVPHPPDIADQCAPRCPVPSAFFRPPTPDARRAKASAPSV